MTSPLAVEAKGLTITYPGHLMQPDFVAVDGIDFAIHRSEVLGLVGESGSGKSTTGRAIAGLQKVSGGSLNVLGVEMNGVRERDFKPKRADIGFVFQDYKLLANKTVWQNVAFALEVIGTRRSAIKSLVPQVLQTVGLTGKENNYPHELSGGEQQRVAIARAYVNHPQILLADEPTGNLDPTTSLGIMEVLDAINRTGTTIVMPRTTRRSSTRCASASSSCIPARSCATRPGLV